MNYELVNLRNRVRELEERLAACQRELRGFQTLARKQADEMRWLDGRLAQLEADGERLARLERKVRVWTE
jgi:hypothetical protein